MALGAITVNDKTVTGNKRVNRGTGYLTSGANYSADGEAVTAATFGLSVLEDLDLSIAGTDTVGVVLRYDAATSKILGYECDVDVAGTNQPMTELAGNHDGSTYLFNWKATGH